MEDEKKLISLKEASEISGYSADYIGQLIRAGKIPGKQVYTNITWMTTADAVLEYKTKSKSGNENSKSIKDNLNKKRRLISMEIDIIKMFFKTFKTALPILLALIITLLFLGYYFIYLAMNKNIEKPENKNQNEQILTY